MHSIIDHALLLEPLALLLMRNIVQIRRQLHYRTVIAPLVVEMAVVLVPDLLIVRVYTPPLCLRLQCLFLEFWFFLGAGSQTFEMSV